MGTNVPFLLKQAVFGPNEISAMSIALEDVCKALGLDGASTAKETIAVRIIELARRGERSPAKLRNRVLAEANSCYAREKVRRVNVLNSRKP